MVDQMHAGHLLRPLESGCFDLAQDLRPVIPAVTEIVEAGTLRLDIRIDGQQPGERPGACYNTPRLHLLVTGQDFVVPYGWEAFSELLGLFTLYARHPEAVAHGHQGVRVMSLRPDTYQKRDSSGSTGCEFFCRRRSLRRWSGS